MCGALAVAHPRESASSYLSSQSLAASRCNLHATPRSSHSRRSWSTWSAVISLTSRAGELRSAPSGPDDRDRVAGKKALAPGVRVRRARALK